MWDLTKASAKEFAINYLSIFFENQEFKLRRTKHTGVEYYRKLSNGFDGIAIGFVDSFPGQKIRYSVFKRISELEKVTGEILKVIEPSKKVDKESLSLAFSFRTINNLRTDSYMPEMLSEEDVKKSCFLVQDFMCEAGFPILEKYNNIKEIDKEINGENFWTTDWQMPFNLGGDFDIKRIIVAWLAENPNFEEVVDKTYEIMSQNSDGTYYDYDRNDLSLRIPYTVHYLKTISRW